MVTQKTIRPCAVCGLFYPSNKKLLNELIESFLSNVSDTKIEDDLKALIVPHAGYIYSGQTASFAYKLLSKFKTQIKNIILIGPSHFEYFEGAALDGHNFWQTPLGETKLNYKTLYENIRPNSKINNLKLVVSNTAHAKEHCLEVQLPFIQHIYGDTSFSFVPILFGDLKIKDLDELADIIINLLTKTKNQENNNQKNNETLLIFSSDLSHYEHYGTANRKDALTINSILSLNIEKMQSTGDACGKLPILLCLKIANKLNWNAKLLNYKNSGDTAGDKSKVVGYASVAFFK